jgi:hypothetical protein
MYFTGISNCHVYVAVCYSKNNDNSLTMHNPNPLHTTVYYIYIVAVCKRNQMQRNGPFSE